MDLLSPRPVLRAAPILLACLGIQPRIAASQTLAPPATAAWVDQWGDQKYEYGWDVALADGSVYVTGTAQFTGGFAPPYLRRYSTDGTFMWERSFDTQSAQPLTLTAEGSRVCVGGAVVLDENPYTGETAGLIQCLDSNGNLGWGDEIHATREGFAPFVVVNRMVIAAGALYATGWTMGALTGDCVDGPCQSAGGGEAFIRRYDADGSGGFTPAWTVEVGSTANDYLGGLEVDAGGTARVWGYEQVQLPADPWVDNTLVLGCYQADGSSCGESRRSLGRETPLSGGFVGNAFYLARGVQDAGAQFGFATAVQRFSIDASMDITESWSDSIPNANAFAMSIDGLGVILAGQTLVPLPGQQGAGSYDAFVRRYDETGRATWTLQFGTNLTESASAVARDESSVYLTGWTTGALEPGVGVPLNNTDGFVARIERPDSPQESIEGLIEEIQGLLDDGILHGNSLLNKLQKALDALEAGDTKKAVTMLKTFINEVTSLRDTGVLEPALADGMIATATAVIASISG
jgi:hypothetical protein